MLSGKKSGLRRGPVEVRPSSVHGYGVFALQSVRKGFIFEESPVIIFEETLPQLADYSFRYPIEERIGSALALGYGSLFNSSLDPNVQYHLDIERQVIVFKARRDVRKNEELFISYGDEWFKSRSLTPKPPGQPPREWWERYHLVELSLIAIVFFVWFFL